MYIVYATGNRIKRGKPGIIPSAVIEMRQYFAISFLLGEKTFPKHALKLTRSEQLHVAVAPIN